MTNRLILLAVMLLCSAVGLCAQSAPACTTGATQIATGLSATTFTDSTAVDGQTYFYITTANNQFGAVCSNISNGVTIPNTGTHTVSLVWTASTTPGVTYGVFRATPPAPPGTPVPSVN